MKTEYRVIWHTKNVTKEQMEKDMPSIQEQCEVAERFEPFFPIFGGTVSVGTRTYQVMPMKAKGTQ